MDVGGESTRPGAARVDIAEQIARTQPVIAALAPLGTAIKRLIVNDLDGINLPFSRDWAELMDQAFGQLQQWAGWMSQELVFYILFTGLAHFLALEWARMPFLVVEIELFALIKRHELQSAKAEKDQVLGIDKAIGTNLAILQYGQHQRLFIRIAFAVEIKIDDPRLTHGLVQDLLFQRRQLGIGRRCRLLGEGGQGGKDSQQYR